MTTPTFPPFAFFAEFVYQLIAANRGPVTWIYRAWHGGDLKPPTYHIASALFEAVRRGWARLRRRPDPGYVDAARLLPVAYVVASALLVMGVVLIVGDLVVPVHLGRQRRTRPHQAHLTPDHVEELRQLVDRELA